MRARSHPPVARDSVSLGADAAKPGTKRPAPAPGSSIPRRARAAQGPTFDPTKLNEAAFIYYRRIRSVREYVERHPDKPLSLSQAARIAGLERTYFSTHFREKTGVRFKDWLTHMRIRRAMEVFRTADLSVTEVALGSGFDDLRTFERAFRRYVRVSPSAYRKSVRPR